MHSVRSYITFAILLLFFATGGALVNSAQASIFKLKFWNKTSGTFSDRQASRHLKKCMGMSANDDVHAQRGV